MVDRSGMVSMEISNESMMIFKQYFPIPIDRLVESKGYSSDVSCLVILGQVLTISTNINQQIYLLNEKIRAVLSLAFQHFHTIFEEFNRVHEHFQVCFHWKFHNISIVFL